MDFFKALDNIADNIKEYRKLKIEYHNGSKLNDILKQVSATLYYLEKERANFHDQYQKRIQQLILEGSTVARAENMAHSEIPEIYLLRRTMDSAYEVCNAIRTNLSWLKQEKNAV